VAVEVGVEGAEEGAAIVADRARRRHPPVGAEDVVDDMVRAAQRRHCHLLCLLPLPVDVGARAY
jgi:hypothetical protein